MTQANKPALTVAQTQHLRTLLETGLPRCSRPYLELARRIKAQESDVLQQVQCWHQEGLFRRFGLVIYHRRLGIRANVMLVLDIPDHDVQRIGQALATEPDITLCYQRRRQRPEWPYNLFCMIHGRDRTDVTARANAMLSRLELTARPHQMLFSVQAFKQRGARFTPATDQAHNDVRLHIEQSVSHE